MVGGEKGDGVGIHSCHELLFISGCKTTMKRFILKNVGTRTGFLSNKKHYPGAEMKSILHEDI